MSRKPRDILGRPRETDDELLQKDRARANARKTARELRRAIKALERELDAERQRGDFFDDLEDRPDPKPYKIRRTGRKKGALPQATYVMLASDWHVGERVRPETVSGRNEYKPEIAEERAEQFFKSNLTMLKAARGAWDVRRGIFWLGGDLITGYIHEEYESENYLSPSQESLLAFDIVNRGIRFLLDHSDLEHILIPTNHGNHGRTTHRYRVSAHWRSSYEWMLYEMLERRWAEEPRLKFQIARGYHNVVDVYGVGIRFHHGEQIQYMGGVGGISVPALRRITRQAQGEKRVPKQNQAVPILLDCFGHHHTLGYPGDFMQNGSLIGWNLYADSKGLAYEEPVQASFVIDERHKLVSNFNPILVK